MVMHCLRSEMRRFTITRRTPGRFIGIRVPREAVALLLGRLEETPIRLVPHPTEALNLLVTYASAIAEALPLATPELQRLAVSHMHDPIAAAQRYARRPRRLRRNAASPPRDCRRSWPTSARNLGDGDLGVAENARRHRVTPRYIHKLFESEGLTFSAFVLSQRLSRAHRILSDPCVANRNISSVAFDVGFGDLSHFNRTFRRRYAATPTDIRHLSMSTDPPRP